MVNAVTPLQPYLVDAAPSPAPCVPPVALGFCPLCLAPETRRDNGGSVYVFGCGTRLDTPSSAGRAQLTTTETCMQGWAAELHKALAAVAELAQNSPPTLAALEEIETLARAQLCDLAIYSIR